MSRLFISYSRRDAGEVYPLATRLEEAGHKVWLDRSALQAGSRWQEEIVRGIERTDLFLILLSKESVQSKNVEREVGLAYVRNKPILPVMLRPVETPPQLQYALAGLEVIDISADAPDMSGDRLLNAIASPAARTRKVYVDEPWRSRGQRYLWRALWLAAIGISTVVSDGKMQWMKGWPAYCALAVLLAGGVFWAVRRARASRRLKRYGTVLETDFRGFLGQGIASEWRDPATGRRFKFYSKAIREELTEFVERKVPVIVDPENFRTYRTDLSFLPQKPRGALGTRTGEEASSPRGAVLAEQEEAPGHIFVSYAEEDGKAAGLLVSRLEAAGHTVWAARQADEENRPLEEDAVSGIEGAWLFLLVLSPASAASERIRQELQLATSRTRRILVALLRPSAAPAGMDYALIGAQRIDLSVHFDAGMARLLEMVASERSREAAEPIGVVAEPAAQFAEPLLEWVEERFSGLLGWMPLRDLPTSGQALLTEYKRVYTYTRQQGDDNSVEQARILSQWRDPVSRRLYLFRSRALHPDVGDFIKTKDITVYVDPDNISRYSMDLSFLAGAEKRLPSKTKDKSPAQPAEQSAGCGIFLSCSRQDRERAGLLLRTLESEGYPMVNRSGDEEDSAGEERLQSEIQGAQTFLLVVPSPAAGDFGEKARELRLAQASGRTILPVTFGESELPAGMQLALAGIQRIALSSDPQAGMDPLLRALGPAKARPAADHPADQATDHPEDEPLLYGGRRFSDRVRDRLIGVVSGACSWTAGSILPVILWGRGWGIFRLMAAAAVSGMACGSFWGAIVYKRRLPQPLLVIMLFISAFLFYALIYTPAFSHLAPHIAVPDLVRLSSAMLGGGAFLAGRRLEEHGRNRRMKKTGRLLLTEYKGLKAGELVCEWRDPRSDKVHLFLSRNFKNSTWRIPSSTIPVYVDRRNAKDYYIDLSEAAKAQKRDPLREPGGRLSS